MLYQHFNSTLWNKIKEIGVSVVQSEVKELQELVSNLTDKCVAGYFENKDLPPEFQVYKQPGVKVLGIKVRFPTLSVSKISQTPYRAILVVMGNKYACNPIYI